MDESIQQLIKRIDTLEQEHEKHKLEVREALTFLSNKFGEELQNVMEEYKQALLKEAVQYINNYKQH
jgi:phage host-nuclease inhibitor protein Gam